MWKNSVKKCITVEQKRYISSPGALAYLLREVETVSRDLLQQVTQNDYIPLCLFGSHDRCGTLSCLMRQELPQWKEKALDVKEAQPAYELNNTRVVRHRYFICPWSSLYSRHARIGFIQGAFAAAIPD